MGWKFNLEVFRFGKKVKIIIFGIIAASLIAIIAFIVYGFTTMEESGLTPYEKDIIILNEKHPSDIMLYGEDISFKDTLNYRKISEISEEELDGDGNWQYHFIIMNDLNGSVALTQEEANLIMSYINEKHYTFFYIGSRHEDIFLESGILERPLGSNCRGFRTGYTYGWVLNCGSQFIDKQDASEYKTNPEALGDWVANRMVFVIKTEN